MIELPNNLVKTASANSNEKEVHKGSTVENRCLRNPNIVPIETLSVTSCFSKTDNATSKDGHSKLKESTIFPVFGKMAEYTGKSVMGLMDEKAVVRWIQSGKPPIANDGCLPSNDGWETIAWSGWPMSKKNIGTNQYSQRIHVHFRNLGVVDNQRLYASLLKNPYTNILFLDSSKDILSVVVKAEYSDEAMYKAVFNQVVDYYQHTYSIPQRPFTIGNDYFGKRYKVPYDPKLRFNPNSRFFTVNQW